MARHRAGVTEISAPVDEIIKSSGLKVINEAFLPENRSRWTDFGNNVRGPFDLLEMNGIFSVCDLPRAVEMRSRRLRRIVRLATAYELIAFAGHGWDFQDVVMAFGSKYAHPNQRLGTCYPILANFFVDRPELKMSWQEPHYSFIRVLCIIE